MLLFQNQFASQMALDAVMNDAWNESHCWPPMREIKHMNMNKEAVVPSSAAKIMHFMTSVWLTVLKNDDICMHRCMVKSAQYLYVISHCIAHLA